MDNNWSGNGKKKNETEWNIRYREMATSSCQGNVWNENIANNEQINVISSQNGKPNRI